MTSVAYNHMSVGDMCSENMFNTHLRASLLDNPRTCTSPLLSALRQRSRNHDVKHVLQAEGLRVRARCQHGR
jgi:hypothetical protein